MDAMTLGMILAGAGQGINALSNWVNSRRTNTETRRRQGIVEPALLGMVNSTPGQAYNTGQDWLMQSLRSNPWASSDTALQGIVGGGGNPFDTTELFRSLGVLDQQARGDALAQVQAGSSGLGERFGTAKMREAGSVMQELLNAAAARNAGIAMQSHEGAQGRLLDAAGQLGSNATNRASVGSQQAQLLMADPAGQQRLAALQLLMGQPMANMQSGVGNDIGSIGQLLAMMTMLRGMNTQTARA